MEWPDVTGMTAAQIREAVQQLKVTWCREHGMPPPEPEGGRPIPPTPTPPDPKMPRLLTTLEACAYLRVCKQTLFRWARAERIASVKLGRARRWKQSELDRLVERRSKQMR